MEEDTGAASDVESGLDWSVSGISAASGFDPDRYNTEVSSSPWATPEKKLPIREVSDIARLLGNVKELQSNLASISEKTVTPVSSPRNQKPQGEDQQVL